mgnify:CR=1 FL=1
MKNKGKACAALLSLLSLLPSQAEALYEANSETGAGALDFIENRRRIERENMLTDEQQKLIEIRDLAQRKVDSTRKSAAALQEELKSPRCLPSIANRMRSLKAPGVLRYRALSSADSGMIQPLQQVSGQSLP